MSTDNDLRVKRVAPAGQAEAKGVKAKMRVVAVGGYVVTTEEQLRSAVQAYRQRTEPTGPKECAIVFLKD